MKRLLIVFSVALMLLSSCVTSKRTSNTGNPVAFVEARNYFHIGDETEVGNKELLLTYDLKQGAKQSYSTQPFFILIVNRKYEGYKIK